MSRGRLPGASFQGLCQLAPELLCCYPATSGWHRDNSAGDITPQVVPTRGKGKNRWFFPCLPHECHQALFNSWLPFCGPSPSHMISISPGVSRSSYTLGFILFGCSGPLQMGLEEGNSSSGYLSYTRRRFSYALRSASNSVF